MSHGCPQESFLTLAMGAARQNQTALKARNSLLVTNRTCFPAKTRTWSSSKSHTMLTTFSVDDVDDGQREGCAAKDDAEGNERVVSRVKRGCERIFERV